MVRLLQRIIAVALIPSFLISASLAQLNSPSLLLPQHHFLAQAFAVPSFGNRTPIVNVPNQVARLTLVLILSAASMMSQSRRAAVDALDQERGLRSVHLNILDPLSTRDPGRVEFALTYAKEHLSYPGFWDDGSVATALIDFIKTEPLNSDLATGASVLISKGEASSEIVLDSLEKNRSALENASRNHRLAWSDSVSPGQAYKKLFNWQDVSELKKIIGKLEWLLQKLDPEAYKQWSAADGARLEKTVRDAEQANHLATIWVCAGTGVVLLIAMVIGSSRVIRRRRAKALSA